MSDWIDVEKQRRDAGLTRALRQDQHAAVNSRYPGTTQETCCECGDYTGRAGASEDSMFGLDGEGPFCERCFHTTGHARKVYEDYGDIYETPEWLNENM